MSVLEKYSKKTRKEESEVLTARLPKSLYKAFQEHCKDLGLSISEGVYLLVREEMSKIEDKPKQLKKDVSENTKIVSKEVTTTTIKPQNEVKTNTKQSKNESSSNGKFTVTPYSIEKLTACPICEAWISRSNFKRHCSDQHDKTPQQIFESEQNKITALGMVKEKSTQ